LLHDADGNRYIDFLAGAGTLNYGHNEPRLTRTMIEYLESGGVIHGLDMVTAAKEKFLETFERTVFWPLDAEYKVQFTGPTGTNAVEAAFKLARKVTGRENIISFTNGFHGVTLGSVAATGNAHFRGGAGVPLNNVSFMPYDGYFGDDIDSVDYLRQFLEDTSSGVDLPAAVIVETVQGEGGVNVARFEWLRNLRRLCDDLDILLIVDDIQVGCGRTGPFFSFATAGIVPDLITLSKSLSASGLPMSLLLMRPELDQWKPGEHNGTFRGNNLAFVSATRALELFWQDDALTRQVKTSGALIRDRLTDLAEKHAEFDLTVRGRGMIWGVESPKVPGLSDAVMSAAFERGLIIETCGPDSRVIKLLPPLITERPVLEEGLSMLEESYQAACSDTSLVEQVTMTEVGS
jgi:diaminobutyrate-2-oxoglutarate transaminase